MWMVNFRADHALQTLTAMDNRFNDTKTKIMVCSLRYNGISARDVKTRNDSFDINKPGGKIWAYILLHDRPLSDVREAHVREDIEAGNFIELSREYLAKIAPLKYDEQCLPRPKPKPLEVEP